MPRSAGHVSRDDFAKWGDSLRALLLTGNLADDATVDIDARSVTIVITGRQVRLFERIMQQGIDAVYRDTHVRGSDAVDPVALRSEPQPRA